ncbi:MAG: metallophosphoesterase [Pseudomonadota bacterium]
MAAQPMFRFTVSYVAAAMLLLSATLTLAQQDDWQGVERIVVVGDIHGDYDNYMEVLKQAGVVNKRGRWIGKKTHLVQLGDVPDRGPDTARAMRHLMKLETQARRAGGRVHVLIGNHEAMNMLGDLRYVHPGEYEALKSSRASSLRENYFERVRDYLASQDPEAELGDEFRDQWMSEHPLGYIEHRQHWNPAGEFGAWVVEHNTLLRINRTLFVHAGVSPAMLGRSISEINEQVRAELASTEPGPRELADAEDGPLWYRGLASGEETPELAAHLDAALEAFDVDRIVVGHTPGFATVVPRYDGRFLVADSGISAYYGGYQVSLLIEGDDVYTLQRGTDVPVPGNDEELLDYFRRIDEIQPEVNNVRFMIRKLEAQAAGIDLGVDPNNPVDPHDPNNPVEPN